jgi:hypothetical protein
MNEFRVTRVAAADTEMWLLYTMAAIANLEIKESINLLQFQQKLELRARAQIPNIFCCLRILDF